MNKYLWLITNLKTITKLRQKGITNFLFPLKGYCVGFIHTYSLSQIKEKNSYLYLNRNLENSDIDNLKKLFLDFPSYIKGVLFEDVGLINVLKQTKVKKILYMNHYPTNYASVKAFLDYVDSVIIPFDLTLEEITSILDKNLKKLGIYGFGRLNLMYSRRRLLTNYQENYQLALKNKETIKDSISTKEFELIENKEGTVFYSKEYYNALKIHHSKLKYIIVNPQFLTNKQEKMLLNEIKNKHYQLSNLNISQSQGFLDQKTFYKLK